MSNIDIDRTLALAGIFQAAKLIKDIATTGKTENFYLENSLQTLFKIDSTSTMDIFGSAKNIQLGLNEINNFFSPYNKSKPKCPDIARYAFSIIHIERKLSKNKDMLDNIATGINRAKKQADIFSLMHENVIANIGGIYTDTISKLNFRIQVTGLPEFVNTSNYMNKIRAVLLSGIRSAVLWRQLGGSRLHLIFGRKKITNSVNELF